jgi:23S rRNA pseudouridine2605 synthase
VTVERLQKIMAAAGIASRRACEELIRAGRVTVNGQPATIGSKADVRHDDIRVDGKPLAASAPLVYVALHKPRGVVSSLEPQGNRETVRDLVPGAARLFPVGRLDLDSEGLILMTNDGDMAQRLTHPRYGCEKEYRVLLTRRPDEEQLMIWRRGVVLEGGLRTAPALVRLESPAGRGAWVRVVMGEGRKREIREVATRLGLRVERLQRIRIGSLLLGNLRPGQARDLSSAEVRALEASARAPRTPRGPLPVNRPRRPAPAAARPRGATAGRAPSRRADRARPRVRRGHRE